MEGHQHQCHLVIDLQQLHFLIFVFCPFREFDDGPDPDEDDGTAGQGNGGPNGAQVWLQKAKFVFLLAYMEGAINQIVAR